LTSAAQKKLEIQEESNWMMSGQLRKSEGIKKAGELRRKRRY
jgi:hypothetical protein